MVDGAVEGDAAGHHAAVVDPVALFRDGCYRCVATDGTVAVVLVTGGRMVEFMIVGDVEPPASGRPQRRRIGDSLQDALAKARARRRRELARRAVEGDPWAQAQLWLDEQAEQR